MEEWEFFIPSSVLNSLFFPSFYGFCLSLFFLFFSFLLFCVFVLRGLSRFLLLCCVFPQRRVARTSHHLRYRHRRHCRLLPGSNQSSNQPASLVLRKPK